MPECSYLYRAAIPAAVLWFNCTLGGGTTDRAAVTTVGEVNNKTCLLSTHLTYNPLSASVYSVVHTMIIQCFAGSGSQESNYIGLHKGPINNSQFMSMLALDLTQCQTKQKNYNTHCDPIGNLCGGGEHQQVVLTYREACKFDRTPRE